MGLVGVTHTGVSMADGTIENIRRCAHLCDISP